MAKKKFTKVKDLGKFGFDDEIIKGMVEFEIFPTVSKDKDEDLVVETEDILYFIHIQIKNALKIYKMNDELEKKSKEIEKEIDEDSKKFFYDEVKL